MVRHLGFATIALLCSLSSVCAQDLSNLAPADAYFGRFNMSILGISNTIRDAGLRLNLSSDPQSVLHGPLAFATDAIRSWQGKYPKDPWIAKDLLALEIAYLHAPGDEALRLAVKTEAWLSHDYPASPYTATAYTQLHGSPTNDRENAEAGARVSPWERFANLRVQTDGQR